MHEFVERFNLTVTVCFVNSFAVPNHAVTPQEIEEII